jgi:hypothetical protein
MLQKVWEHLRSTEFAFYSFLARWTLREQIGWWIENVPVIVGLGKRNIAFICARESLGERRIGPPLKAAFGGSYIANEKFTFATANQVWSTGEADAVAFGVLFLSNPDLPDSFRKKALHNSSDRCTFSTPEPKGV